LERIAKNGHKGFYHGPIADALVRTVRERGGVLDHADLEDYKTLEREPVRGTYRGYRIVSFPPPSSGGVILLQMLGMLEGFELKDGYGASRTIQGPTGTTRCISPSPITQAVW
jgi:gamma-glutamyltranspeptidase/glutathione hydrolase